MTTLTNDPEILDLPDDLLWEDEYGWRPVAQSFEYSLTGSLLVHTAERQGGRPITLRGTETCGWVTRATLATLQEWASMPGLSLALNLRGDDYDVLFNHDGDSAIEAEPVVPFSDPEDADYYVVTLRFLTLPPAP